MSQTPERYKSDDSSDWMHDEDIQREYRAFQATLYEEQAFARAQEQFEFEQELDQGDEDLVLSDKPMCACNFGGTCRQDPNLQHVGEEKSSVTVNQPASVTVDQSGGMCACNFGGACRNDPNLQHVRQSPAQAAQRTQLNSAESKRYCRYGASCTYRGCGFIHPSPQQEPSQAPNPYYQHQVYYQQTPNYNQNYQQTPNYNQDYQQTPNYNQDFPEPEWTQQKQGQVLPSGNRQPDSQSNTTATCPSDSCSFSANTTDLKNLATHVKTQHSNGTFTTARLAPSGLASCPYCHQVDTMEREWIKHSRRCGVKRKQTLSDVYPGTWPRPGWLWNTETRAWLQVTLQVSNTNPRTSFQIQTVNHAEEKKACMISFTDPSPALL